jgi:hypothetical protein
VLDRKHLIENGALAAFTDPDHPLRISSVEADRGVRPWSHAGLEQARRAYWRYRYRKNESETHEPAASPPSARSPAMLDPMAPEWEDGYPLYWGRWR